MVSTDKYEQRASECLRIADHLHHDEERRLMRVLGLVWHTLSTWAAEQRTRRTDRVLARRPQMDSNTH